MNWRNNIVNYKRFENNNGILYHADSTELLKLIPDNSVDAIITDPPYAIRQTENWDAEETFNKNLEGWVLNSLRIARNVVIWFTAGIKIPQIVNIVPEYFHRILVWNKPPGTQFAGASHSKIWYSTEFIIVFAKRLPILNDPEVPYIYSCINDNTIPQKKYNHPTVKPVSLMAKLIEHYSYKNDIILDPFCGTGSTLIAAELLNRNWIGIEKDILHCNTAIERMTGEGINLFSNNLEVK